MITSYSETTGRSKERRGGLRRRRIRLKDKQAAYLEYWKQDCLTGPQSNTDETDNIKYDFNLKTHCLPSVHYDQETSFSMPFLISTSNSESFSGFKSKYFNNNNIDKMFQNVWVRILIVKRKKKSRTTPADIFHERIMVLYNDRIMVL